MRLPLIPHPTSSPAGLTLEVEARRAGPVLSLYGTRTVSQDFAEAPMSLTPTAEALLYGIIQLQQKIRRTQTIARA